MQSIDLECFLTYISLPLFSCHLLCYPSCQQVWCHHDVVMSSLFPPSVPPFLPPSLPPPVMSSWCCDVIILATLCATLLATIFATLLLQKKWEHHFFHMPPFLPPSLPPPCDVIMMLWYSIAKGKTSRWQVWWQVGYEADIVAQQ